MSRRSADPSPETHQVVRLVLEKGSGDWVKVNLIRSIAWIRDNDVRVGGTVWLALHEMGCVGEAEVQAVEPCPDLRSGAGEPVTGTFEHSRGEVGELRVEGESKPIGVTPAHLFWSEDRRDFVPVGELKSGERVRVGHGTRKVLGYELTGRFEPVYNIEVDGDHVYRVGDQAILVHNASASPSKQLKVCSKMPPSGHARDYQVRACGAREYYVEGGGLRKCADAVEGTVVVDCKALINPQSSPQLGTAPAFIADPTIAQWRKDLSEYETIVKDPCSGYTMLVVRVEDDRQVAFWHALLRPLAIPTGVEVVP